MTTYIVTFEIKESTRKLKFKEKLKEFDGFCPIHSNAWAIRTELKAKKIRDTLAQYISSEDKIFVIRSGTEAAWRNTYGIKHSEWLKKYL